MQHFRHEQPSLPIAANGIMIKTTSQLLDLEKFLIFSRLVPRDKLFDILDDLNILRSYAIVKLYISIKSYKPCVSLIPNYTWILQIIAMHCETQNHHGITESSQLIIISNCPTSSQNIFYNVFLMFAKYQHLVLNNGDEHHTDHKCRTVDDNVEDVLLMD